MTVGIEDHERLETTERGGNLRRPRGRPVSREPVRVYVPRRRLDLRLGEVWAYRYVIPFFGVSFIKRRFRDTWLGLLWVPLRPGLQTLFKAFVFGGLLQVSSGTRPYLIFLMVGQAGWDLFDKAVYWSFRPLTTNRRVLARTPVPWAAGVLSALIPAGVDAAQFVLIGGIASVYYKLTEGSFYFDVSAGSAGQLVGGVVLLCLWAVSVGLIIAPLVVKARDVRFLIRYTISFWYFLTPVLYATSSLPAGYRAFAEYNPITAPIEMIKDSLLGTGAPGTASLAVSVIGLAVALPVGLFTCSAFERQAHARL